MTRFYHILFNRGHSIQGQVKNIILSNRIYAIRFTHKGTIGKYIQ